MAGLGGDSVSLLFELWAGNNNRRRRASEKESFDCRLYQDSGNWELFLLFSLFRISSTFSFSTDFF